ncbi:sigma-70 family RNA polymerase sigma factor [Solibacillus sp. FSL R7-0668]|uniref:sigma-70 family RNA polymerase sigma factor n=1 Tax=Solibacillus sp. FSL R7-0668 TaxID=2921688 RepID=UPI0030F725DD
MTLTMEQEQLVLSHTKLSHHLTHKYYHEYLTHEDLASVGFIGLVKASKRFDESLGYKFSTLAATCIRGEIIKSFRKKQIPATSLHQPYSEDENIELIDCIRSDALVEDQVQIKMDLTAALTVLDERERDVILYRFGLGGSGESLSQLAVGERMGLSQVHVSRIERAALAKLRRHLTQGGLYV